MYIDIATGFVAPPFWLNRPTGVLKIDGDSVTDATEYLGNLYQDSLRMRLESGSDWYTFPFDPVISVTCKNNIIRRDALKVDVNTIRRGSIKEIWSQDDYEVNIAGILKSKDGEGLPESDLRRLRDFCEAREVVEVESVLFSIFGITRLAIADYSLPFTRGIENQQFAIKAYSDELFDLILIN
jgi:hypothetical protein